MKGWGGGVCSRYFDTLDGWSKHLSLIEDPMRYDRMCAQPYDPLRLLWRVEALQIETLISPSVIIRLAIDTYSALGGPLCFTPRSQLHRVVADVLWSDRAQYQVISRPPP